MTTTRTAKKPAAEGDWHWADVLAALRKQGWSLQQVAKEEGYKRSSALGHAADRPYPKAEEIIARYVGVDHPKVIWPSRYNADGTTNRPRGRPALRGRRPARRGSRA